MASRFFEHPILNSPYEYPSWHWELDASGQPTQQIVETRRIAQFITPIPKPRKRKESAVQEDFEFDDGTGISTHKQRYEPIPIINELRRQSYDLNEERLFNVEYADVLGIPFDFAAKPAMVVPVPPRQTIQVKAVRPDRDALEIRFPRVMGYRVELPNERFTAKFTGDSLLSLDPTPTGPSKTQNVGIVGENVNLTVEHLRDTRPSTVLYRRTTHPRVRSYVKNHNLGFDAPYRHGSESRIYRPDFIVLEEAALENV